jgi:hypothetical protein
MATGPESVPIDPELLGAPTEPELLPDPELLLEPELLAPETELLIEAEWSDPASSGDVLELPEVTLIPEDDPSLPPASAEPAELVLQAKKTVVARMGQKARVRTSKARFRESAQSTHTLLVPCISSPRNSTGSTFRAGPVPVVLARAFRSRDRSSGPNAAMRNVTRDATLKTGG